MYGGTGTCAGAFNTCDSATTGTSIHPTGCLLTFLSSLFATIETKANRVFSKISSAFSQHPLCVHPRVAHVPGLEVLARQAIAAQAPQPSQMPVATLRPISVPLTEASAHPVLKLGTLRTVEEDQTRLLSKPVTE